MSETYWSLLTNVPHLEWELTLLAVENGAAFLFGRWWLNRRLRREHDVLDAEHGHTHPEIRKGSSRPEAVSNVRVLEYLDEYDEGATGRL